MADTAQELYKHNVTSISLWPGAVRTEFVQNSFKTGKFEETASKISEKFGLTPQEAWKLFDEGETSEFSGRGIVHLAAGKNIFYPAGTPFYKGFKGIVKHFFARDHFDQ